MTESLSTPEPQQSDDTRATGPQPSTGPEPGVRGGNAGRPDGLARAPGSGGLAGAGADGETGAAEQLRKDLGERDAATGTEEGGDLEQAAASARPTIRRAARSRSTGRGADRPLTGFAGAA
jgi:hypothetical protein